MVYSKRQLQNIACGLIDLLERVRMRLIIVSRHRASAAAARSVRLYASSRRVLVCQVDVFFWECIPFHSIPFHSFPFPFPYPGSRLILCKSSFEFDTFPLCIRVNHFITKMVYRYIIGLLRSRLLRRKPSVYSPTSQPFSACNCRRDYYLLGNLPGFLCFLWLR